ncbi:MAG: hypothetical protein QNJ14_15475 [Woeseiaceae bacterium]|nr:hypothetical protein [Woeseiaceae bacterium]
MAKKILAVLAVLASLAWAVDIALTIAQGNAGPPIAVKAILIVAFLYYAYKVFFGGKARPKPAAGDD